WAPAARFLARYRAALAEAGNVDAPGALSAALAFDVHRGRFDAVLVDDGEAMPPAVLSLVSDACREAALAWCPAGVTWRSPVALRAAFRQVTVLPGIARSQRDLASAV